MRFRRKIHDRTGYDLVVRRDQLERAEREGGDFIDAACSAALDLADSKAEITRISTAGENHVQIEFSDNVWFDVTLEREGAVL